MSLKRKSAAKVPYEGYALPKSSEKGGSFIDFKRIVERKAVKKVKVKRNANIPTNK